MADYCKCEEDITQYYGRVLLSLEIWRRYHPILCSITAILGNVETVSRSVMADYCKCEEDITQYYGRLLLPFEMLRRYHAMLWSITAILGNVEMSPNTVVDYCYSWKVEYTRVTNPDHRTA